MTDPTVLINGTPRPLGKAQNLVQLLDALGVNATQKAIEQNGVIIPVSALAQTPVAPDDQIEIIQFVGGG